MRLIHENPDHCTPLGMIPKDKLVYKEPTAWNGCPPTLSKPTWSMNVVVAWNAAAQEHLLAKDPNWLSNLRATIPGMRWDTDSAVSSPQSGEQCTAAEETHKPAVPTSKFLKLKDDTAAHTLTFSPASEQWLSEDSRLQLKCPDWRKWAYTDGSCIKQEIEGREIQFIGAGWYYPAEDTRHRAACYVDPGGMGVTNTINRAELAGIYAALQCGHTHIASDSAGSLSQIRKQLLFTELQRQNLHAQLIQEIISKIQASPETIFAM